MHARFVSNQTLENLHTASFLDVVYDENGGQDPALTCTKVFEKYGLTGRKVSVIHCDWSVQSFGVRRRFAVRRELYHGVSRRRLRLRLRVRVDIRESDECRDIGAFYLCRTSERFMMVYGHDLP